MWTNKYLKIVKILRKNNSKVGLALPDTITVYKLMAITQILYHLVQI